MLEASYQRTWLWNSVTGLLVKHDKLFDNLISVTLLLTTKLLKFFLNQDLCILPLKISSCFKKIVFTFSFTHLKLCRYFRLYAFTPACVCRLFLLLLLPYLVWHQIAGDWCISAESELPVKLLLQTFVWSCKIVFICPCTNMLFYYITAVNCELVGVSHV